MDDTFVIHKEAYKQSFLQHINSVDPAIRFTVEDNKDNNNKNNNGFYKASYPGSTISKMLYIYRKTGI